MYSLSFNSKFTLYPSELFSAEASPRIPLGELTTLPRSPRRKFCEGRYIFNFCPPNLPSPRGWGKKNFGLVCSPPHLQKPCGATDLEYAKYFAFLWMIQRHMNF